MTFEEAGQAFVRLQAQLHNGQLTPAQFSAAVAQLRLQDASGQWWQLDPASGAWLIWNGTGWVPPPASPPTAAAPATRPPAGAAPVGWGQIVWDVITLAGCSVMAGVWYWYSGMAETAPDTKSCITIVALPFALMVTRRWTDRWLLKLQPHVAKIPRMVLLGLGLAIPFLVANQLYGRYTEFEYLFRTLVISTLLTYVLFRSGMVRPRSAAPGAHRGGKS